MFESILKLGPSIRYVTICDLDGRITKTGHSKGVKNILSSDESKKSLTQAVGSWKLRNQLSHKIGKGTYALVSYEKIKRITIPLGTDHLIYLTIKVDADHNKIIEKILDLISKNS